MSSSRLTLTPNSSGSPSARPPEETTAELPIWLQRTLLVIYVLFCIELGLMLVIVPWTRLWAGNSLLLRWPAVQTWLMNGFVRGSVSGLGFVDIWLGVLEAARYRDRH